MRQVVGHGAGFASCSNSFVMLSCGHILFVSGGESEGCSLNEADATVAEAEKAVVEHEAPAAVRSYGKSLVDLKERLRLQRMSATCSSAPVAQLPSLTLLPLCA